MPAERAIWHGKNDIPDPVSLARLSSSVQHRINYDTTADQKRRGNERQE